MLPDQPHRALATSPAFGASISSVYPCALKYRMLPRIECAKPDGTACLDSGSDMSRATRPAANTKRIYLIRNGAYLATLPGLPRERHCRCVGSVMQFWLWEVAFLSSL